MATQLLEWWPVVATILSVAGPALWLSLRASNVLGSLDKSVQHLVTRLDKADERDALLAQQQTEALMALSAQSESLTHIAQQLQDHGTRIRELESGSWRENHAPDLR